MILDLPAKFVDESVALVIDLTIVRQLSRGRGYYRVEADRETFDRIRSMAVDVEPGDIGLTLSARATVRAIDAGATVAEAAALEHAPVHDTAGLPDGPEDYVWVVGPACECGGQTSRLEHQDPVLLVCETCRRGYIVNPDSKIRR